MKLGSATINTLKLGSSQVSKAYIGATEVWSSNSFDTDAAAYFAAIATAGSSISSANQTAVNAFIVGCKADGIWSAIKASCLLCAADSLAGALVPLVGSAPTNNGFVSGDYSRTLGLTGNGTSKYLATGRNALASDLRNNHHAAVRITGLSEETGATGGGKFGPIIAARASGTAVGSIQIIHSGIDHPTPSQISGVSGGISSSNVSQNSASLAGVSRSSSSSAYLRHSGSNLSLPTTASEALANAEWFVFGRTVGGSGEKFTTSRVSYYSVGESLDLALLDARLATLMAALT